MKFRSILGAAVRVSVIALLLLPAVGCPRKKIIFHLSPSSLMFSADEGGPPPADQILTMTGISEIPHGGATWTLETDQPWLSVAPTSGYLHAREAVLLTVSADQSVLSAGMYPGTITIVAHYKKNQYPQTLDVVLDVISGGKFR